MINSYFTLLFPIFSIPLIIAWISKKTHGSWFYPGAFFPLTWFSYMTLSFIMAPEFKPHLIGMILIILFSILVMVGANFFQKVKKDKNVKNKNLININYLFNINIIFSFISLVGIFFVIKMGFSWFQLDQNIFNLYMLPNLFASDRYNELQSLPTNIKVFMFLTYPTALIAGFLFPFKKGSKRFFSFLPILITMLYGALFAVRSGILLSIILTFSGMTCAKIYLDHNLNKWFKRVLSAGSILIFSLFTLYIFFQWIRGGPESDFIINELLQNAKAGILGSFPAFTIWFSNYDFSHNYDLGLNTFAAPMEILGLTARASGYYTDFITIGPSVTNIYSAFRGVISDFGLIGSFVFFLFFGFIGAKSFYATQNGNIFSIIPLSIFYSFTLFSPLISIFTFNSIIVAFVIFFGILILSNSQSN